MSNQIKVKKTLRCAIYTRKSTEDGLEQDFNSLHAQREACQAYASSQKSEGWKLSKTLYDDGGFSGGSLKRPALKRLLTDIEEGRIDLVLVYKIDRLTRSLSDFSKLVDLFDERSVSFISVTQQFNTTTSIGRLTLNMLLSFAQFEREVTGERIRDKIVASKRKGMWMGGHPPLGYDVNDRKLVINKEEAMIIRDIFSKYLELGTVRDLKGYSDERKYKTKLRPNNKRNTGGNLIMRGNLYQILANPLYKGCIPHKGAVYEGKHNAIIEPELFDRVQAHIKEQAINRHKENNEPSGNIYAGKIYDETGDRMTIVYTQKKFKQGVKKYRYYMSARTQKGPKNTIDGWRIPAKTLEPPILTALEQYLTSPSGLMKELASQLSPEDLQKTHNNLTGQSLGTQTDWIDNIIIKPGMMTIQLCTETIARKLSIPEELKLSDFIITKAFTLQKRGVECKLVFGDIPEPNINEKLLAQLKKSQRWIEGLNSGKYTSISHIAEQYKTKPTNVSMYLPMAFLDPKIKKSILEGTQPISLSLEKFKKFNPLPLDFTEQRKLLGF